MVFILYRDVMTAGFRYFAGDREIEMVSQGKEAASKRARADSVRPVYNLDVERSFAERLDAESVVAALRTRWPDLEPSAYLNGSEDARSVKWLLTGRIGRPGEILGYVGPKFQELTQVAHHLFTGKYLAYAPPPVTRAAKWALPLGAIDPSLRKVAGSFARRALRSPIRALTEPLHFQSLLIIQPIDLLPSGRMNMCDGCPDMTVHGDELVWSCRLDEHLRYGRNLWAQPA